MHKTGSYTFSLWRTTNLRSVQNILPTKLYWVLFPIEDLRQAVETAIRILTKEKIYRQLVGQSSSTPFINIKDSYINKKVIFNTQDGLEDKIDRLTVMMSKSAANDDGTNSSSLKYIKTKEGDRQKIYMTNIIMIKETIRIGIDQIAEIEDSNLVVEFSADKIIEVDQGMNKTTGMTIGEEILEVMQECIRIRILEDRIREVDTEEIIGMKIIKEVGVDLGKGHIQATVTGMTGVVVIVGKGQHQE